ncbi:hypothetical protein Tco_1254311 [Tanacetum coccineum]
MSTEVHQAAETVTTSNELDLLFGPLFDEYFNGENQVVLKSSAVTTTDASKKHQQQPDSTSSTSTLAATVTANGNFDDTESDSGSFCLEALKKYDNVLPLTERQLVQYLQKVSRVLYNILKKDQWEKHEKAAISYADLMSEIKGFHNAAYKVHRGTEDAFSTYEKLLVNFQAQYGKDAGKS